jgi:hypothetical protein
MYKIILTDNHLAFTINYIYTEKLIITSNDFKNIIHITKHSPPFKEERKGKGE